MKSAKEYLDSINDTKNDHVRGSQHFAHWLEGIIIEAQHDALLHAAEIAEKSTVHMFGIECTGEIAAEAIRIEADKLSKETK